MHQIVELFYQKKNILLIFTVLFIKYFILTKIFYAKHNQNNVKALYFTIFIYMLTIYLHNTKIIIPRSFTLFSVFMFYFFLRFQKKNKTYLDYLIYIY